MAPVIPIIMAVSAIAGAATSIVGATKTPKQPQAPDTSKQSQQALESAYAQSELLRKRQGYGSTILTGPQGANTLNQGSHQTLG